MDHLDLPAAQAQAPLMGPPGAFAVPLGAITLGLSPSVTIPMGPEATQDGRQTLRPRPTVRRLPRQVSVLRLPQAILPVVRREVMVMRVRQHRRPPYD